jgi:hypothetical protein
MIGEFHGWGFPMWEFLIQSLRSADTNVDLHVKFPSWFDFAQKWNVSTNFSKTPNIIFNENPFSRSEVFITHADRRTDETISIGAPQGCGLRVEAGPLQA